MSPTSLYLNDESIKNIKSYLYLDGSSSDLKMEGIPLRFEVRLWVL